jgi:hypothetical protein
LEQVGTYLAFIGGGAKRQLTPKERKENNKKNKRDYANDQRALQYCDKAWQQYEAKKKDLLSREIFECKFWAKAVDEIDKAHFSRKGVAVNLAQSLFLKDVKRDVETLLSKKILR